MHPLDDLVIPERSDFQQWLNMRRSKRVGYVCRTTSCPLANCLRAKNPGHKLHVSFCGDRSVVFDENDPTDSYRTLPQWASDFAESLDTLWGTGAVDGAAALSVLKDIEQ